MKCEICGYVAKRKCDYSRHIKRCKFNKCLYCGKDTLNPKYCNNTCSALNTTKGRIHTDETKFVKADVCAVVHENLSRDVSEIKKDVKSLLSARVD